MTDFTTPTKFFHGSYDADLEEGRVLKARPESYEGEWAHTDFYSILEHYRPSNMLAHKDAVFMVDSEEDVDFAGGATDAIYEVEPVGKLQRHDMNWSSEISVLMSELGPDGKDHPDVRQAAEAYWCGFAHTNESVWEYLAPAMRIIKLVDEEVLIPAGR